MKFPTHRAELPGHLPVKGDGPNSRREDRYYVLGKTDNERLLFIVFTIRNNKIRVISARKILGSDFHIEFLIQHHRGWIKV